MKKQWILALFSLPLLCASEATLDEDKYLLGDRDQDVPSLYDTNRARVQQEEQQYYYQQGYGPYYWDGQPVVPADRDGNPQN